MRSLSVLLALGACSSPSGPSTPLQLANAPKVEIISGDSQTAAVAHQLALPILVRVVDTTPVLTGGQPTPVLGQIVNFVVTSGGGSVFAGSSVSDSLGRVQELWTLGDTAKVQTLEARAVDNETGAPLTFAVLHATATAGPFASGGFDRHVLRLLAGGSAAVPAHAADAYGNPLPVAGMTSDGGAVVDSSGAGWTVSDSLSGVGWLRFHNDSAAVLTYYPLGTYTATVTLADTVLVMQGTLQAATMNGNHANSFWDICAGSSIAKAAIDSAMQFGDTLTVVTRQVAGGTIDTLYPALADPHRGCQDLTPANDSIGHVFAFSFANVSSVYAVLSSRDPDGTLHFTIPAPGSYPGLTNGALTITP